MPLFPNPQQCQSRLNRFPPKDAEALRGIRKHLTNGFNNDNLLASLADVQTDVLRTLGRWGAYRNQGGSRNTHFLEALIANDPIGSAFSTVFGATLQTTDLALLLNEHRTAIDQLYHFLRTSMLLDQVPARIVTISKALWVITGFSVGLDSRVLKKIKMAKPYALTCPGVWPFCLYWETLEIIASEQQVWEHQYGRPLSELLPGVPIGQVMDRILWTA